MLLIISPISFPRAAWECIPGRSSVPNTHRWSGAECIPTLERGNENCGSRGKQLGFSLLELMVVLGIIGLTAAIVLPRLGGFEGRDFRVQVREAKAILEHARRTAIVQGQAVDAVFLQQDTEADAAEKKSATDKNSQQDLLWQSGDIRLSFNQRMLDTGETVSVTFFPEGGSTAGDLVFQKGVLSLHVQIDAMTGRIRFVDNQ